MRHRSFYMRSDVADRLAQVVDDLHFSTRRPRHEVLAALVDVTLGHRSEIEARLTEGGKARSGETRPQLAQQAQQRSR
jgi:hypothetical protein